MDQRDQGKPSSLEAATAARDPDELEPTFTSPAGRFWDIELRPDMPLKPMSLGDRQGPDPDELEPTITTPAGRFWDIELPPDIAAGLGLDTVKRR
jgi:hypothetical protein